MKLNLGCGNDVRDGYVNVDWFAGNDPSIVHTNLSHFPWPFADGCAEQILMLDFLEHFPYSKTRQILMECHRILHQDGEVVIQVPDAGILGCVLSGQCNFPCNRCGNMVDADQIEKCSKCGQGHADAVQAAMKRMFGGQDFAGNFHQTCFTHHSLYMIARECGLYWNRSDETEHQYLNWNFKSVFIKGDVW